MPQNLTTLSGQSQTRALEVVKRRLARHLSPPVAGLANKQPTLTRRWATVSAVNVANGTCSILIEKSTIPNVARLQSYIPTVGDAVIVDFVGSDPVIIGRVAAGQLESYARIYRASANAYTQAASGYVQFPFDTTDYDPGAGISNNGSGLVYTPPIPGLYLVTCELMFTPTGTTITYELVLNHSVHGALRRLDRFTSQSANLVQIGGATQVTLDTTGNIALLIYCGGTNTVFSPDQSYCWFEVSFIRPI